MAIEGPLKELGIHDVFQLLDLSRKTGVLRVTSPLRRNQGTVCFDRGAIVAAEVRSNPHPLGGVLLRSGKVSEADLQLAREIQERGDARRLGEILVDQGVLSRRDLERHVRLQIEEVVFEVMSWREGYFSFAEGPLVGVRADAIVRIPTEALLMEGARRIDEWSRIERQVPHLGMIPALAPDGERLEGALELLPSEWEVLALIDGSRDIRAIAQQLGRSDFDVAKVMFGLHSSGVVTLRDPVPARGTEAPPGLEEGLSTVTRLLGDGEIEAARLEAEALVATHPTDARAQLAAARVQLAGGRPREAEAAGRRALAIDPLMPEAHRALGDALAAQGRFGDAVDWWERWLSLRRESRDDPERARIRAAVEAARTLHELLGGARG